MRLYHLSQDIRDKNLVYLSGDISAGDKPAAGQEGPKKLKIIAHSGSVFMGPLGPTVLDLSGCRFDKDKTAILMEHDREKRLGYTTKQSISPKDSRVEVEGLLTSKEHEGLTFYEDLQNGFPFQASVGILTEKVAGLKAGEQREINGKTYSGPLSVITKSRIREVSVAVLGADSDTSVQSIAASQAKGVSTMGFDEWVTSLGLDPKTLSEGERQKLELAFKAAVAAGTYVALYRQDMNKVTPAKDQKDLDDPLDLDDFDSRLAKLQADRDKKYLDLTAAFERFRHLEKVTVAGKEMTLADYRTLAISDPKTDIRDVELVLMKSDIPKGPAIHVKQDPKDSELHMKAIECALVRMNLNVPAKAKDSRGSDYGYEVWYPEKVLELSDRVPHSLHYLMDLTIEQAGMGSYRGDRNSESFVNTFFRAQRMVYLTGGHSTHQISNVLENVGNKFLLTGYRRKATSWSMIVEKRTVNDFKPHAYYFLGVSGGFVKIGPDGLKPNATLFDVKRTLQADTRGQMLTLTRQQLRNDDLGALDKGGTTIGENAALALEEEVYDLLLTNRASFVSGGSSNLDIDGLKASEKLFMDQLDTVGKPILAIPDRIIVGTQDAMQAKDLFGTRNLLAISTIYGSTGIRDFAENPFVGRFTPIVSPYLNVTGIKKQGGGAMTNQDANQWYMLCDPAVMSAIVAGFLDGKLEPTMDSEDMPWEFIGGIRFRIYHDWGLALNETKAMVYNAGA